MSSTETEPSYSGKEKSWELYEQPFTSSVPVVGGLIVGFRNLWNSVAAKWYIRPLVHQQNIYNEMMAEWIDHLSESQIIEDRERAEIGHDIAEITALLVFLNRSLEELEERLTMLEQASTVDQVSDSDSAVQID